ncbi:uncharacterized protein BJ171DRAFT_582667 [Polychytrium aggregatum]|uniref:uncharacterized protein n=1 Tax=Polychytrium aggregatum TaxID=110093 RepID=UPI0022FDBD2E|nr:uncharacterized protein BJ171DRAFT_582667 [Polychytrium aggregatum]KAI9203897.1 hypothetical protein BJ171DRAFT_582667 [Polychytrium aggregatum]
MNNTLVDLDQEASIDDGGDQDMKKVSSSGDGNDPSLERQDEGLKVDLPKVTVYKIDNAGTVPWKNGLGETLEVAIYPPKRQFEKDQFLWRLSLSTVRDNCSLSVLPGYDMALVLLPGEDYIAHTKTPISAPAVLHHNDQETAFPLKPLVPYTYNGSWPTACHVKSSPLKLLTFMANRKYTQVSVSLETICPHGLSDDGICNENHNFTPTPQSRHRSSSRSRGSDDETANPTSKILLGAFTIVYVISGGIKVKLDGDICERTILPGETLTCERHDESDPTGFAMTPLNKADLDEAKPRHFEGMLPVPGQDKPSRKGHQDATVLIIQADIRRPRRDSITSEPQRPPIHRKGSIIVFDDQPAWGFGKDLDSTHSISDLNEASSILPLMYWDSARHYRPPVFSARFQNESEVPPPTVRDSLAISEFPTGKISTLWINMVKQGLSEWLRVPVIIARGSEEGPVVGITAVVHGNELNGVPCIHRVITDIDVYKLKGTVVAVPCVNVPGYLRFTREFSDGKDLNRLFPGNENGTASQIYAHMLITKIINHFDFLIDLHTASFGRINSYYVRSDMNDPVSAIMAKLQQPQIILHNSGQDGTLRSAASSRGIKAITVEIGNPQLLQNQYVQWSYMGVMRILSYLNMFKSDGINANSAEGAVIPPPPNTIICSRGFWIYTKTGGVLEVYPSVNTVVRKGDLIARIKNIFGNIVDEIYSPSHGVTIGRSSNPVAMAGDRILHLGVIKKDNEVLPTVAKENY